MVSLKPGPKQSISDLATQKKTTHGDVPPALVGASTTVIGDNLYVFGGRVASTRQMTNHMYTLHMPTLSWVRHIASPDSAAPPSPRYFHSATAYKHYLVVFGGMSTKSRRKPQNEETLFAMNDISMFNVETMSWVEINIEPSIFNPQARYAHLATLWNKDKLVVMGGQDVTNQHVQEMNVFDITQLSWIQGNPIQSTFDAYRAVAFAPDNDHITSYYGTLSTPLWKPNQEPPVCVYSNYNFNDLMRDLSSFLPLQSTPEFYTHDMPNHYLPPGLRFPTAQMVGQYLIISGTVLSAIQGGYHIWALNLTNLTWTHVDTGKTLSQGSWNRGLHSGQKYYILGHHERDLKEDYGSRRLNFEHIGVIDLEVFGILNLPKATCSSAAQELGLGLMDGLSDITLQTSDHQTIAANSTILAERWPDFAEWIEDEESKVLCFSETYAVTHAFLQFLYTNHLITAQQHQPNILARLLILADIYNLKRLRELSTFALHQLLTISTANLVYETALLTSQNALQLRALRVLLNTKRMLLQYKEVQNHPPPLPPTPQEDPIPTPPMTPYPADIFLPPPPPSSYSFSSLRRLAGKSDPRPELRYSPSKSTPTSSISKKKIFDHSNFSFNVL
ncbi:hypothetical protein CU098_009220 [Rhizopus stolonifer]|uniref:BTB domain-containing protein n=1 Tax=Rhizopus stolonifer TaxID=4846 RepID=A0A367JV75_RHIST|nr:hypothetical protein CU098_009220 [Rhizopus stolonifer]